VTAVDRAVRETLKQFLNSSEIKSIISYKMQRDTGHADEAHFRAYA
jgi:hypothetical protein